MTAYPRTITPSSAWMRLTGRARTPKIMPGTMKKYGYIDATRGWAIIGVLIIHATTLGNNDNHPAWLSFLARNGSTGVQLFYIASALTLFFSLQSRTKVEKTPTKNFFIRRYFRIAPLYCLAVGFYLWLEGFGPRYWLGDAQQISTSNIVANLLLVHQANPYWINSIVPGGWSIAVEMSFYLLVPLLFSYITNLSRAVYFFLASIALGRYLNPWMSAHNPITSPQLWGDFLYFYLPTQLPVFALGIVLFFLIDSSNRKEKATISPYALLLLVIGVQVMSVGGYFAPILYSLIVLIMSQRKTVLLDNPIIRFVGTMSYGIYICHWGCMALMRYLGLGDFLAPLSPTRAALNFGLRFTILLLTACFFSYILHRLIEVPFQRLGAKIIARREERGAI